VSNTLKTTKRKVDLAVIHCSATKETDDYSFDELKRDHAARGFAAPGYHRYVKRDGTILIGRHFDRIGAHVSGSNANSIGICYEGGLDANGKAKDTRTEAQKISILKCLYEAMEYAGPGGIKRITGHRDLSPDLDGDGVVEKHEWVKMCPCFEAEPEYKHLLSK
jgi:N-acetylmuramoyl-L-alanine amidase